MRQLAHRQRIIGIQQHDELLAALGDALDEIGTDAGTERRRLFDIAGGWNDSHPAGAPVVVVTHSAPAEAADADRPTISSLPSGCRRWA